MAHEQETLDKNLQITDRKFQDLYLPELEDHPGLEKGGACMLNAYRTAEYLIGNGVPRESLQLLYIVAPTPMGSDVVRPNVDTLRPEEQEKAEKKGKEVEWAYHSAVMTKDKKQVFDLSSDKSNWGKRLDEFMVETFLDDRGYGNGSLRFIVTTLDSLDELVRDNKGIEVGELTRRGEDNDGGKSSIWMLQNKLEDEWYWKND